MIIVSSCFNLCLSLNMNYKWFKGVYRVVKLFFFSNDLIDMEIKIVLAFAVLLMIHN